MSTQTPTSAVGLSGVIEVNLLRDLEEAAGEVRSINQILQDRKLPEAFTNSYRHSLETLLRNAKERLARSHRALQNNPDLGVLHLRPRARVFHLGADWAERDIKAESRLIRCRYKSFRDGWSSTGTRIMEPFIEIQTLGESSYHLAICLTDVNLSQAARQAALSPAR